MKKIIENLKNLVSVIQENKNLEISFAQVEKGYSLADLKDLESGLEIKLNDSIRSFYAAIGSISLLWAVKPGALANEIHEDDIVYLSGSIQILNPFDMVMGKAGTKWKDVLWFENTDAGEMEILKSFMPFDFPGTELAAGFCRKGIDVTDTMFLYTSNEGVSPLPVKFMEYLDKLHLNRGFSYWQQFGHVNVTDAFRCYNQYMPVLFPDFLPV